MPRPHPTAAGTPSTQGHVRFSGAHLSQHRAQGFGVERAIPVHERDVIVGRSEQPGLDGGAVSGDGFGDDAGPEPLRHGRRVIARPVIDHDHVEALRDTRKQRQQGGPLVAARNDQVADWHVGQDICISDEFRFTERLRMYDVDIDGSVANEVVA